MTGFPFSDMFRHDPKHAAVQRYVGEQLKLCDLSKPLDRTWSSSVHSLNMSVDAR